MSDTERQGGPSALEPIRRTVQAIGVVLTPRRRTIIGTAVGLGLVLLLVGLRAGGAERNIVLAWTWVACAVAVLSPFTGLIVVAGVLPFSEWVVFETVVGAKAVLIPFLAAGVFLRPIGRPGGVPRAVSLGLSLAAITGAGVMLTAAKFGPEVAETALHGWVAGIGGGLVLFAIAWWTARGGSVVPAAVVVGAVSVGAVLSLAEFAAPGVVRDGALGVLLRPPLDDLPRVTGIIPAPNAVATLFAATVAVVVPQLGRVPRGPRIAGWLLVATLVAATVFTYSRSGIISLVVVALLAVAARSIRWATIATAVAALAVVVLLPAFMLLRAEAMGVGATFDLGAVISGDVRRFEGWTAAARMFRASPLVGHGFGSFRELAFSYGSTYVTAPHNEVLRFFAEGGLLAGSIALAWLAALGRSLWGRADAWGRAGLGALLALVMGGMFNNPLSYIQVVGPVLILVGIALGARRVSPVSLAPSAPDGLTGG